MRDYFVHPTCVVEEGVRIGAGSRIWCFCHLQRGSAVGKWCSLGQNVNLGDRVKIGNFVKIQNNVSVYEGVELEDGVFCGPSCVFTNDLTPRSEYPKGHASYQKTLVDVGRWSRRARSSPTACRITRWRQAILRGRSAGSAAVEKSWVRTSPARPADGVTAGMGQDFAKRRKPRHRIILWKRFRKNYEDVTDL